MKIKRAVVRTNEGEKIFKIEIWEKKINVFKYVGRLFTTYEKIGSATTLDDALALIRSVVSGTIRGFDLEDK